MIDTEADVEVASGPNRFYANAFWLLLGQAASKGAGFIFVVIVARGLGAQEYGYFNFALSFVALFLLAGSNTIELAVIREVARNRNRLSEVFSSGLVLRGGFALAALSLAVALSPGFVHGRRNILTVAILGTALCFDELSTYLGGVYKAFERVALHSLAVLGNRVVSAVLAFASVSLGGDILVVSIAYLLGSLGALAFGWFGLRRYFPPIRLVDVRAPVVRDLLREGLPLGLAGVFNSALFRIDIVLLQVFKGPVAVGLYGIAYRFFESFLFVGWSLADVTLPSIARAGPARESGRVFQLGVTLMLAVYLPIAVVALFASEWIVTKVFSDAFRSAAAAVPWLAAATGLYGVAYAARVSLVALRCRRAIVWIAGATLVVNVVANVVVIPRYGFMGAAAVTCVSEALEAVLLVTVFARVNGGLHLRRLTFVPWVAAGTSLVVLLCSGTRDGTAILVGVVAYLGALIAAGRILGGEESRAAIALLRRRMLVRLR